MLRVGEQNKDARQRQEKVAKDIFRRCHADRPNSDARVPGIRNRSTPTAIASLDDLIKVCLEASKIEMAIYYSQTNTIPHPCFNVPE